MSTNITFNSNDLQTDKIITESIEHHQWPRFSGEFHPVAHANRSKIVYGGFPSKTIVIKGTITDTSISALDTAMDAFRAYFIGFDKDLDIDYAGSTRRYTATANKVAVERPYGLTYADFLVEFIATDPFGRDTTTTSALTATGRTLSTYDDDYTFLGSAPYQLPVATIEYTALTGGTAKTVEWGNLTTGQTISVTRTWVTNDILVIDVPSSIVKVNGVEVDFTGAFPTFPPGARTMTYLDDLTTRTFDIDVDYNKRYM